MNTKINEIQINKHTEDKTPTGHTAEPLANIKKTKMRQLTLILFALIALISCNKETEDVPDYKPGRLTELSYEYSSVGLIYHKYEYADNEVIDKYYYSSPEIFISKYHFKDNQLKKVHYLFENTSKEYYPDSLTYNYSDSLIIETKYYEDESHEESYVLKNGKIVSSSWTTDASKKFLDFYFEWSGDNLTRCEQQFWIGQPLTVHITEYVFEYSDIENPFYYSNIPSLMKEFNNPYNNQNELSDLIPKCSRNFPRKLTIILNSHLFEGRTITDSYYFECKTFPNANKPFEVKVTDGSYGGSQVDYILTYEEL